MLFTYSVIWNLFVWWHLAKYHPKLALVYYSLAMLVVTGSTLWIAEHHLHWIYHPEKERLSGYLLIFYFFLGGWMAAHFYRAYHRQRILDRSLSSAYRYFHQPYALIQAYVMEKPLAHQVMWRRYLRDTMRWQIALWLMISSYLWLRDFLGWRLSTLA